MDEDQNKIQWLITVLAIVACLLLGVLYFTLCDKPDFSAKFQSLIIDIIPNLIAALMAIPVIYFIFTSHGIESHSPSYARLREAVKEGVINALSDSRALGGTNFAVILHTLIFESLIASNCRRFDDYDQFFEYVKIALLESDASYHVMSVTRESISNFYSNPSLTRGEGWKNAQMEWIAKHPKKEKPKRIFLYRGDEFRVNDEFRGVVLKVASDLDSYCELLIIEATRNKLIPRDFGLFFKDTKIVNCVFTYTPISQGRNFTKLTSSEYGTKSEKIHFELKHYFNSIWNDAELRAESADFKKLYNIGVPSESSDV